MAAIIADAFKLAILLHRRVSMISTLRSDELRLFAFFLFFTIFVRFFDSFSLATLLVDCCLAALADLSFALDFDGLALEVLGFGRGFGGCFFAALLETAFVDLDSDLLFAFDSPELPLVDADCEALFTDEESRSLSHNIFTLAIAFRLASR